MKNGLTLPLVRSIIWLGLIPLFGVCSGAQPRSQIATERIPTLTFNKTESRRLRGGETHYFKVNMHGGEYVHVTAQQQGIDIVLTASVPGQSEEIKVDRPNAAYGREGLSVIAQQDGECLIRINSLEPKANEGTYSINLDVQRPSVSKDGKMMSAESEVTKAEDSRAKNTPRELERGIAGFRKALSLWQELNDPYEQGVALYGLAYAYRSTNEYQKSVSCSLEALLIVRELKDQNLEAALLTNLGWAYVYLGDTQLAFNSFTSALTLRRLTGDKNGEALTLYGVGWFYALTDNNEKALAIFDDTLTLRRQTKSLTGQAVTLIGIAKVLHRLGRHSEAIVDLDEAIKILRESKNRNALAEALSILGWVESAIAKNESALGHFNEALKIWQSLEDRAGEATTRYGIARAETRAGRLSDAQQHMRISLELVEAMRARGENQRLRTSFFSLVQDYYEFAIDLFMRLHKENPGKGYANEAFQISERSRNRNLLDLLNEASIDIRQGVDPPLIQREESLRQQLAEAVEKQRKSAHDEVSAAEKAQLALRVSALSAGIEDIQAQIRKVSPHYALLTQARPVSSVDVQQRLLDDDTMLLEYSLGDERSYLWALTRDELLSFELPNRTEIERLAARVHKSLTARNEDLETETVKQKQERITRADVAYEEAALQLSNVVLGPVTHKLDKKRLVVVAHALLQVIPFAALPSPGLPTPNATREPLLIKHEIVNLPSASVLAVLRQRGPRAQPRRTLAIVADPVFSRSDERFSAQSNARKADVAHAIAVNVERSFPRLFNTRWEATKIASYVPEKQSLVALDFSANKDFVIRPEFGDARFLHFATHTVVNDEQSELSGIALSNFNADGRKRDGFLRTNDIYHLHLRASLVVLSSCQSALGKEIKGEGLVGLTHGFMYAGAPRVVASLWTVSDNPTAQLMARFYDGMLGRERMSPAAALRAAQLSMLKDKRWRAPYFWSAFVIQGEWR